MDKSIVVDKPRVKLVGTDGNAFAIIGRVSGALKKAGLRKEATEFANMAFDAESYDALLRICMDYVEVY